MNRRNFLAASAAFAALAPATNSQAQATKRLKVIIPVMSPEQLSDLQAVAPAVDLVQCSSEDEAVERVVDAAACYGFLSRRLIRAGKSLKWVQQPSAGVEHLIQIPELVDGAVVLTNMQRTYGPEIADQAIGYLLAFTRDLGHYIRAKPDQKWASRRAEFVLDELAGKTMLVIGLGGIGSEIAPPGFWFRDACRVDRS